MRTNCDITIYNKRIDPATRSEVWYREQIKYVSWEDRKAANIRATGGQMAADAARVFIPFSSAERRYLFPAEWDKMSTPSGYFTFRPGDIVVKGQVCDDITSEFTLTDLREKYPTVLVISSVDTMDMGSLSMRHWNVGLK